MSNKQSLLLEIGCEEIPARMIQRATEQLEALTCDLLTDSKLSFGAVNSWGGSRRLAVHLQAVESHQEDRNELFTGPPAKVAFKEDGTLTKAAEGFAKKQGVETADLKKVSTERGEYVGFEREVKGKTLAEILTDRWPELVAKMSFSKTMRWTEGIHRWVRPVHWVVALYGSEVIPIVLFDIKAGHESRGHRVLAENRSIAIESADDYVATLRKGYVVIDPQERKATLDRAMHEMAAQHQVEPVEDVKLLSEISDLVEYPSVVCGAFDKKYLELPNEILITTLRHHQKCFASQNKDGELAEFFFAVSNMDEDRAGHIQRGNEWVVSGRLDDANFFWSEDLKTNLDELHSALNRVVFHKDLGSYVDKEKRIARIAKALAKGLNLDEEFAGQAALCCKHDLVTGTVGEFPELQGVVGGLLLKSKGENKSISDAIYEHYQPTTADSPLPTTPLGALLSIADRLDTTASLIAVGERPSGSKDPFGLRRAINGVFRILIDQNWNLSLSDLLKVAAQDSDKTELAAFLSERLENFFIDQGANTNEVRAVQTDSGSGKTFEKNAICDLNARLLALKPVRGREDFAHLVSLVKRVDNITQKNEAFIQNISESPSPSKDGAEGNLRDALAARESQLKAYENAANYSGVIDLMSELIEPTATFFDEVLVIDKDHPAESLARIQLLKDLKALLTQSFDIRELSGSVDGGEA